jgi:hypothetical protein
MVGACGAAQAADDGEAEKHDHAGEPMAGEQEIQQRQGEAEADQNLHG